MVANVQKPNYAIVLIPLKETAPEMEGQHAA